MVDPVTWRILSMNPFGAEQLGYASDELVGQPIDILFPEADRERARKNKALCLERLGRTMSWELRKLRKDGSVIWARETGRAMLLKNRPVVLIVSEDITEAKRAAEALREAQAQLAHATGQPRTAIQPGQSGRSAGRLRQRTTRPWHGGGGCRRKRSATPSAC